MNTAGSPLGVYAKTTFFYLSTIVTLALMLDQGTPASVKVRAAECVMTHSSKAIEVEDVEFRVAELERAVESRKPGSQ